jgi:predicted nucleic acid-binding protein
MKIILDTNAWCADLRLKSNQYASLFDYLRRTSSSLVILNVVLEEVLGTYERQLREKIGQAETAAAKALDASAKVDNFLMRSATLVATQNSVRATVDIPGEQAALKEKLLNPSPGISAVLHDVSAVSVQDVWRRGINRKRPANGKGEELRDVIIWLGVLQYARDSKESVAFISKDSGFWDGDNPHADVLADISEGALEITLYKDIDDFNRHYAFHAETLAVEAIRHLLDVRSLDGKIVQRVANWFASLEIDGQPITFLSAEVVHASFGPGIAYDTTLNSQSIVIPYKAELLVKMLFPHMPPSHDVQQVGARANMAWHHFTFAKVQSADTEAAGIRRVTEPAQHDGYESNIRIFVEGQVSMRVIGGKSEPPEIDALKATEYHDEGSSSCTPHLTTFKDSDWATANPPLENLQCPECKGRNVAYEVGGRMFCRQCGARNYTPS